MNYKKVNISNVEVYLLKDTKFKTTKIKTILINDFNKDNFTKERLLSNFLSRSTNEYKDELSLSKRFIELYDPSIRIYDTYFKAHFKNFSLNMLNEKYTDKNITKDIIDFYFSFIFNPNFKDIKSFKENYLLSEKSLEVSYKYREEDNKFKAINNAFSLISEEAPIKYDINGNIDELKKIKEKDIIDLYNEELKNSACKIFVVGDFDSDEMVNMIRDNLNNKFINKNYDFSDYIFDKKTDLTIKEDSDNINQSILVLIYKFLGLTKDEILYTLPVFNFILGTSSSKLYRNVREKHSLAYSVYSSVNPSESYMHICAGISKENYEKAKEKILKEVDDMKKGNITDEELSSAKESFITRVKLDSDSQSNLLNLFKNYIIFDEEIDDEKIIKKVKKITINDIVNLSNKLSLDVIYFLRGDK